MRDLHPKDDIRRLVGFDLADDAGVYQLDEVALIQTVDVITPIVDDPYSFGRIAAANAISDVYAMGGKPITALNILAFPDKELPLRVATDILRGGMDACEEAGCSLLGGHTLRDDEVKYGLAVTGVADPDDIITNAEARPGDVLVLTKPLGTGIISTAVKKGRASARSAEAASVSMSTLNKSAFEAMEDIEVNACTDVTGFGLGGHVAQMAGASEVTISIESAKLPLLTGVLDLARKGLVPGGTKNNFNAYRKRTRIAKGIDPARIDVIFDAQTSGGLLFSVSAEQSDKLVKKLKKRKTLTAKIVGRVEKRKKGYDLIVRL